MIQGSPKGGVLLSSWLKSIGKGAMVKSNDMLMLSGALSTLQSQANINIHLGGRSALELQGNTHYLQLNSLEVTLFAPGRTELPLWFIKNEWDLEYRVFKLSLLENDTLGLTAYRDGDIEMNISNPTRAMLECLALAPKEFSLNEAFELMEGLTTLRPKQVQELLENCKSIKVKRLFLYFAERAGHSWFKYIDQTKIDLGSGNRTITPNGVLVPKYSLVLAKDLAE